MLLAVTTNAPWMHLGLERRVVRLGAEAETFAFKALCPITVGMIRTVVATPRDKFGSMRVAPRSDCTASKEMDMRTSSKTVTKPRSPGGQNFRAVLARITLGDKVWMVDLALKHPTTLRATAPQRSGTIHTGCRVCGGGRGSTRTYNRGCFCNIFTTLCLKLLSTDMLYFGYQSVIDSTAVQGMAKTTCTQYETNVKDETHPMNRNSTVS